MPAIRYTQYSIREYETHISAEKKKTGEDARVSQALFNNERAGAAETPAQKGTRAIVRVGLSLMPRKNTLSHADFARAEKAGFRRARGSLFVLSFGTWPGQKTAEIKAACVVSKKTAARAVSRNLIKRRWREAMRKCLPAVSPPCALIFYATRPAAAASSAEVEKDVASLVARAGSRFRA